MRGERDTARSELNQIKDELATRDRSLDNLQKQLKEKQQAIANLKTENQKLEEHLAEAAKNEIFLSEELQRFKYGISLADDEPLGEQLQLFPTPEELPPEEQAAVTPELETENTESPAVDVNPETVPPEPEPESNPKQINFTGTIPRGELVKYINEKFQGVNFKSHQIGDCFCLNHKTGKLKSSKLPTYETDYGFKYVGIFEGEHRFRLNSNP